MHVYIGKQSSQYLFPSLEVKVSNDIVIIVELFAELEGPNSSCTYFFSEEAMQNISERVGESKDISSPEVC